MLFEAIAVGSLLQLLVRTAAELQELLPVLFKVIQDSGDDFILLFLCFTERCPVHMNMETTGAALMTLITHPVRPGGYSENVGRNLLKRKLQYINHL